jgi:hypothetical protein
MSKPSLQLIHCSNGIRPGAKRRQNGRSFRPFVIHEGVRSVPGERSWEAALELIDLGFWVFYGNYLAFLEASTTVLGGPNWTDPEEAGKIDMVRPNHASRPGGPPQQRLWRIVRIASGSDVLPIEVRCATKAGRHRKPGHKPSYNRSIRFDVSHLPPYNWAWRARTLTSPQSARWGSGGLDRIAGASTISPFGSSAPPALSHRPASVSYNQQAEPKRMQLC